VRTSEPLVSVVIPTIDRHRLVTAAVESALRQSLREIEVIVVVDGPDPETVSVLQSIDDARLRILPLPENLGLAGARHAGIDLARGRWIALLDDDDEWLPQKLAIQIDTAEHSRYRHPIVACRVIARTAHGDAIRPLRNPAEGEELGDYLFCRTRLLGGEGLVLPSTLLAPRDLFRDVRFRFRSAPFEGSDWLLRAVQREGVGVEFVATHEPLAIWNCAETRARMSNAHSWRASLDWVGSPETHLTPQARAAFILNRVSREARHGGDLSALWLLPWEAFRKGRPSAISLVAHAIVWLVPRGLRSWMVAFNYRRRSVRDVTVEEANRAPDSSTSQLRND
jgi:glycosyltransferase involved in cell wall biosynthesis